MSVTNSLLQLKISGDNTSYSKGILYSSIPNQDQDSDQHNHFVYVNKRKEKLTNKQTGYLQIPRNSIRLHDLMRTSDDKFSITDSPEIT